MKKALCLQVQKEQQKAVQNEILPLFHQHFQILTSSAGFTDLFANIDYKMRHQFKNYQSFVASFKNNYFQFRTNDPLILFFYFHNQQIRINVQLQDLKQLSSRYFLNNNLFFDSLLSEKDTIQLLLTPTQNQLSNFYKQQVWSNPNMLAQLCINLLCKRKTKRSKLLQCFTISSLKSKIITIKFNFSEAGQLYIASYSKTALSLFENQFNKQGRLKNIYSQLKKEQLQLLENMVLHNVIKGQNKHMQKTTLNCALINLGNSTNWHTLSQFVRTYNSAAKRLQQIKRQKQKKRLLVFYKLKNKNEHIFDGSVYRQRHAYTIAKYCEPITDQFMLEQRLKQERRVVYMLFEGSETVFRVQNRVVSMGKTSVEQVRRAHQFLGDKGAFTLSARQQVKLDQFGRGSYFVVGR